MELTVRIRCATITLIFAVLMSGCEFPYAPRYQPLPAAVDTLPDNRTLAGTGTLHPVNPGEQSCNPSIAPGGLLNGCMLFLGFDRLAVTVPDSLAAYRTGSVVTHDRCTILDTSNTVRWFVMRDALESTGDLQCPEWSTHPDYLACLAGHIGRPYSGYAVRLSDHAALKIADGILEEFSTPHFWLPDSAGGGSAAAPSYTGDGLADRATVAGWFGTGRFKYVYTLPSRRGALYYVDYTSGAPPEPVPLAKPQDRENWYCSSPLISPDGTRIAYHCFPDPTKGPLYTAYVQELAENSLPVPVAEGASDPHWWVDETTGYEYIVCSVTFGNYFTEYSFTDTTVEKRMSAGYTLRLRLAASGLNVDTATAPDTLIRLPFKGGLSRDGRFLATAYKYAYTAHLDDRTP